MTGSFRGRNYLCAHLVPRGWPAPPGWAAACEGRAQTAASPGSVLSSQFLALCKRHPALVVELAKELLEFAGGAGSTRGGGVVLTSVVRGAAPPPRLRRARTCG